MCKARSVLSQHSTPPLAGTCELWFDFSCPYAYLASRVASRLPCAVDWRPMLLGGVFRGIGAGDGPMATLGPAKALHNLQDMHRWAEVLGVPFQMPAAHPMRTVRALRVLLTLPHSRWPDAIAAFYAAYWERAEDITRDEVISAALAGAGVSPDDIRRALERADNAAIKDELRRRTDEAIALGVFGAPAWILRRPGGHILLWGQDRLTWVEAVLAGWDPDADPPPPPPVQRETFASPTVRPGATLDVYFDVASPFAYLGLTQLPELVRATGVTPRLVPILLGALFRDIGQVDVPWFAMPENKRRYVGLEMTRWARWWGVPFEQPRKFPQRTVAAQRLCLLAAAHGFETGVRVAIALGRAMWAEQRDLEDQATLRAVLAAAGVPGAWADRTSEPALKQALIEATGEAKQAGVFGVPTFVVDKKHLFWGQDRLDFVARALGGWSPRHG
ncbi:MAG: 2-hydroxychromene-2-carboxylate isomerase [Kofleriaceae bacterium]|nr:2-hydroxychromene-2-carboxylate isomerase [Kofleriaceae bacterium]